MIVKLKPSQTCKSKALVKFDTGKIILLYSITLSDRGRDSSKYFTCLCHMFLRQTMNWYCSKY